MKHSVRQILIDNWANYKKNNRVSAHVEKEVMKMMDCSKNSCNSRLCTSCGKRHTDNWAKWFKGYIQPKEHTHIVLTVPDTLRPILTDWNNLKIFMDCSKNFYARC